MGGPPRARLILALLLAPAAARADGDDDPDTEIAQRHFARGSASYNHADYELALREFQAARRAKPLPPLDFNIGRCLDRLERWRDAAAAYRRYLAEAPAAPDAAEVRARVEELERRLAQAPAG